MNLSFQDEQLNESQNGHSVLREQLVSNHMSSQSQKNIEGMEETLGSMVLDDIDKPSTSAES